MFLKGEIGATWLRGYFTTRLSGYVTKRLRSYVATSIKERVKFLCSVLVSAKRGGRNRGVNLRSLYFLSRFLPPPYFLRQFFSSSLNVYLTFFPSSILFPPISPSSQLLIFGPFFPPPYSVPPPSSRIILSAHGLKNELDSCVAFLFRLKDYCFGTLIKTS